MSEGSTFPPVFRLRMDMVDLRGERLMSKSLEISSAFNISVWYSSVDVNCECFIRQLLLLNSYCFEKENDEESKTSTDICRQSKEVLSRWPERKSSLSLEDGLGSKRLRGRAKKSSHAESTWDGHRALAHTLSWSTVFGRHRHWQFHEWVCVGTEV